MSAMGHLSDGLLSNGLSVETSKLLPVGLNLENAPCFSSLLATSHVKKNSEIYTLKNIPVCIPFILVDSVFLSLYKYILSLFHVIFLRESWTPENWQLKECPSDTQGENRQTDGGEAEVLIATQGSAEKTRFMAHASLHSLSQTPAISLSKFVPSSRSHLQMA